MHSSREYTKVYVKVYFAHLFLMVCNEADVLTLLVGVL